MNANIIRKKMMNVTAIKISVLLLIHVPIYCMDQELQTTNIPVVSSAELRPFSCKITPEQREVIENVLRHKTEYATACCPEGGGLCKEDCALWSATYVSLASFMALIGLAVIDTVSNKGELSNVPLLYCFLGGIVMPWPVLIARNCRRSVRASSMYKGYLEQGRKCGLVQHAGSLIELLENGYKDQKLCDGTCSACNTKRGSCGYCKELFNTANGWATCEKKVCNNCWQAMCSRCTVCQGQRTAAQREILINELGLDCSRSGDFKGLQSFLQTIMKKQSEDARSAV